jgi:hypothetical protein
MHMKMRLSLAILGFLQFAGMPGGASAQGLVGVEGVRLLEFRDVDGMLFKSGNELGVRGTPMVEDGWGRGRVHFKNGLDFADSAINMSLYNGRLYVRRNNRYIELVQPAASVSLSFQHEDYSTVTYEFKSGFPAIGELSENTLYEVLFEGNNLQLLSFERKKVVDPNNYGGSTQKEYATVRQLYLYQPAEKKIVLLKSYSMDAFRSSLPSYEKALTKYAVSGKKNPKNKEQFLELLTYLEQRL